MKRLIPIVIIAALLLLCVPFPVSAAPSGDVWDGETITVPSKKVQKDGVEYYEITKCSELAYVAQIGGEWLSQNYLLKNDLILNDITIEWNVGGNLITNPETLYEWTPIGSNEKRFTGVFDGENHQISGIYIQDTNEENYCGLFGIVGYPGTAGCVKNIQVNNSFISSKNAAGGIAGCIENNYSYTNVGIKSCSFDGLVISSAEGVGGIVGISDSFISNCLNYGYVIGKSKVGGILGYTLRSGVHIYIKNCANKGKVIGNNEVGGIVGYCLNPFIIENSYNLAEIKGDSLVGGVVGNGDCANLKNTYNVGNVSSASSENVGAIIGSDGALYAKDTIEGCYYLKSNTVNTEIFGCGNAATAGGDPYGFYVKSSEEMKQQGTYEGWDFETRYYDWGGIKESVWSISPSINEGYPFLSWENPPAPIVNAPYILSPLTIRTESGSSLSAIPNGSFLVTIPVTKQTDSGDAMVLLASYTASGQYRGLLYMELEDVPVGSTVKATILVDNKSNDINQLKAFVTSGFGSFTPLGEPGVFPA